MHNRSPKLPADDRMTSPNLCHHQLDAGPIGLKNRLNCICICDAGITVYHTKLQSTETSPGFMTDLLPNSLTFAPVSTPCDHVVSTQVLCLIIAEMANK